MTPESRIGSNERHEFIKVGETKEGEIPQSIGIAVLVVGVDKTRNGDNSNDPLIWTIKELEAKTETGKKPGEISIPAETRKVGETRKDNVLGALAEFCDDTSLDYIRQHLFLAQGVFGEKVINVNGNSVDLTVLVYDGDLSLPLSPLNSSEVSPNGWMHKSEIQDSEGVRSVLRQAIEQDTYHSLSANVLNIYSNKRGELSPVIDDNFTTISEFYRRRETLPDMPLLGGVPKNN